MNIRNNNRKQSPIQYSHQNIPNKCKKAYNRLTPFPDMRPDLAIQIFKSFIRSKLDYGNIILGYTIHTTKHLTLLEAAQIGPLMLILRAMKSIPLREMEVQLCIAPTDLKLREFAKN